MNLLAPLLAGFAALGAVPIIIHLLNRSRFRVVEWAAMEFLLRTLQKNSRRIQLRDVILMLLRTAAVVLAALALARPTVAPGGFVPLGGAGGVHAVVVVDNSLSMGCRDAVDTRFDLARKAAKSAIASLPEGSAATVVLMSDIAIAEVAEPTRDLDYLLGAIDRAQLSDGGTAIAAGLQSAWSILERTPGAAREIHLVTDLQAHGWPSADDRAWTDLVGRMAAAEDLRLFVADVGRDAGQGNIAVERIEFSDELVGTDGEATVVATLRNHGDAPASDVSVSLLVDDGRGGDLRPGATAVVAELAGTAQVRLACRFPTGGQHRVEVRTGPDRLPADNSRRAVVDVVDRIRVLLVDGSAEGGARGGADFLRAALSPTGSLAEAVDAPADLIATTVVAPGQLAGIALEEYQAVALSDVAEITPAVGDALAAFVASGRGLLVFLGGNVRSAAYNRVLGERGLLPATLGTAPRALVDAAGVPGIGLATADLTHPIVAFFADPSAQPWLSQPRFRQAWPLAVAVPAAGAEADTAVVARFADGQPAVVARGVGRGEVVAFAAPADKEWSDLPLRPAFLMLVRRAVQHAALGSRPRLNLVVHEPIVQAVPARDAGQTFIVRDPRGGERRLTPIAVGGGASVEATATAFAGFYEIGRDGSTFRFAANPPAAESDLAPIAREAVAERLPGLHPVWIGADADVAAGIERGRSGRELWPLLLALAVACLVAESALALIWAPKGA